INYPVSTPPVQGGFGFNATAPVTVASTASATSILGAVGGSNTILAGTLLPGKRVTIRATGTFADALAPPTLVFTIKLASTVIATMTPVITFSSGTTSQSPCSRA